MNLSEAFENLKGFDLNDLDMNNAGSWPGAVKAVCYLLVIIGVLSLFYYFDINELQINLDQVRAEESSLKDQYKIKAEKVANLEEYKSQMVEMEQTFGALLKQLPSDTEVPGLLEDISSVGSLSGLDIQLISLKPEVSKEFYVELPIQVKVAGGYHDLAAFVSGVAGLPRIVTLHDFSITAARLGEGASGAERLEMDISAATYRYSGDKAK
ncbi:MAG: type 4a pilus biogenesis protein PilO [Hahellaceae bacterium]|jgi:type IV pilus assembly protein PilO|nr:type 4a pilus biogenesis protein PilO [Hahellaceae bacterium]